MRALLAAALLLVAFALPAKAAASLELVTPGPYHYGGTIEVIAHGRYAIKPLGSPTTEIHLTCYQAGQLVYTEKIDGPTPDVPYTLHFGRSGSSLWDIAGGGAADCVLLLVRIDHNPDPGVYTRYDLTVEA